MHAHAVIGKPHKVGHGGSFKCAAFFRNMFGNVSIGIGHIALGIDDFSIKIGMVLKFLDEDFIFTSRRGAAFAACGNREIVTNKVIHEKVAALFIKHDLHTDVIRFGYGNDFFVFKNFTFPRLGFAKSCVSALVSG